MALKATIFKARVQIADIDRSVYADHALTIARHPSETDERMMLRVLAFALHVPADDHGGALDFGKGLSDVDEPDLAQIDLTGRIVHWIDLGQPDDKRIMKASGRADRVTVIAYAASTPIWWEALKGKVTRARNLEVWRIDAAQTQALGALAERSMTLQINVQDGVAWVGSGERSVELALLKLYPQ